MQCCSHLLAIAEHDYFSFSQPCAPFFNSTTNCPPVFGCVWLAMSAFTLILFATTNDLRSRRILLGATAVHRSTVTRKGSNWYLGKEEYPQLGPGVYSRPSRSFLGKSDAVVYLPGSRRGFHAFLNSGRSKVASMEGHHSTIVVNPMPGRRNKSSRGMLMDFRLFVR